MPILRLIALYLVLQDDATPHRAQLVDAFLQEAQINSPDIKTYQACVLREISWAVVFARIMLRLQTSYDSSFFSTSCGLSPRVM